VDRWGYLNTRAFSKNRTSLDGYANRCKHCEKEYWLANKEKIRRRAKKWWNRTRKTRLKNKKAYYNKNWSLIQIKCKEYNLTHRDKISKYQSKYQKMWWAKNRVKNNKRIVKRRREDVQFKLQGALRSRLCSALKNKLLGKKVSAVKDLGCTMKEFVLYLESKWEPWMNWGNYGNKEGQWSIDHIKALATFDLTKCSQQKKAIHYTNLQPMLHLDNIRKYNK
jgi:hypothetical protein